VTAATYQVVAVVKQGGQLVAQLTRTVVPPVTD
jgi:hypothetical protein